MRPTRTPRLVTSLILGVIAACDRGHATQRMSGEMLQDTVATAREARVSLAGGEAAGAQTYSYRGLFAGISRTRLESALGVSAPASACRIVTTRTHDDLVCSYAAAVGPDRDHISVEATYARSASGGDTIARTITVERELPLDVDGVRLAQMLADAFEQQTSLLDKRDAEYGRHMAMVRMGTLRGARENYADVTIQLRNGREILTVKLTRSDAAPAVQDPRAKQTSP